MLIDNTDLLRPSVEALTAVPRIANRHHSELEEVTGLAITPELFLLCLVSSSFLNELRLHRDLARRLRFCQSTLQSLGEAAQDLAVSCTILLERGIATSMDAQLLGKQVGGTVATQALADRLRLASCGLFGAGENPALRRKAILSMASRLIGAVLLKADLPAVRKLLEPELLGPAAVAVVARKDPKSHLQEISQEREGKLPTYRIVSESGPDHAPSFQVEVAVGTLRARGTGRTRKLAEMSAAEGLLARLGVSGLAPASARPAASSGLQDHVVPRSQLSLLAQAERTLGAEFHDRKLLSIALMHASGRNELPLHERRLANDVLVSTGANLFFALGHLRVTEAVASLWDGEFSTIRNGVVWAGGPGMQELAQRLQIADFLLRTRGLADGLSTQVASDALKAYAGAFLLDRGCLLSAVATENPSFLRGFLESLGRGGLGVVQPAPGALSDTGQAGGHAWGPVDPASAPPVSDAHGQVVPAAGPREPAATPRLTAGPQPSDITPLLVEGPKAQPVVFPLPRSLTEVVIRGLARQVGRSSLQQIAVESKLLPRSTSREELRRRFPDPEPWIGFVADALDQPGSHRVAQRALTILLGVFVRRPELDHRIEAALNKARLAAERSEVDKLRREAEKLEQWRIESVAELPPILPLLYLTASAECARYAVRSLIEHLERDETAESDLDQPGLLVDPEIPAATLPCGPPGEPLVGNSWPAGAASPAAASVPELERAATPQPAEAPPGSADPLREALEQLTSPVKPERQAGSWGIEQLRGLVGIPAGRIDWPEEATVQAAVEAVRAAATSCAASAGPTAGEDLDVPDLVGLVRHQVVELQARIGELELAHQEWLDAALAAAEACLPERPAEVRSEVFAALVRLRETGGKRTSRDELGSLLGRARVTVLETLDKMAACTERLEALDVWLPEKEAEQAVQRVRECFESLDWPGLVRLAEALEQRVDGLRAAQAKMRQAAQQVLPLVLAARTPVPPSLRAAVVEAVRAGDARQAEEALGSWLAKEQALGPVAAPALPQRISSHEQLSSGEAISEAGDGLPKTPSPPSEPPAPGDVWPLAHVEVETRAFVPRNRKTQVLLAAQQMPPSADILLHFLLRRALEELDRCSCAGVVEQAFDILEIAGSARPVAKDWAEVAFCLLAALPPTPPHGSNWGGTLGRRMHEALLTQGPEGLHRFFSLMFDATGFDEAVSERLVQKEVAPFASLLAARLHEGATQRSAYLLEDLARGIGRGARWGDPTVAQQMLAELARQAGVPSSTMDVLGRALEVAGTVFKQRPGTRRELGPLWLAEGVREFEESIQARERVPPKGPTSRAGTRPMLHVEIPRSVGRGKGFCWDGGDELEIALLVGNPKGSARPVLGVELSVPLERNKQWLDREAICSVGALDEDARRLVPLRLMLREDALAGTDSGQFELHYMLVYKEPGGREGRVQDGRIELRIVRSTELEIQDYVGAAGKPLVLAGEALRQSSASVRTALQEILKGLQGEAGTAALVIGRRRRGKTSILETIKQDPDVRARYVVVSDSQEDLPFRSLEVALRRMGGIFDRAVRHLGQEMPLLAELLPARQDEAWIVLQDWLEDLSQRVTAPVRLLLLIDEFQKWIALLDQDSRNRVLAMARGLFNRPSSARVAISVVLSGLSNISEYSKGNADFRNAFRSYELKPFKLDETAQLVRSNSSIEFDTRAVGAIHRLSGGNPFLINLLGSQIVSRLREHGRTYCLLEDVHRVVDCELENPQNSRVWSFLQYMFKEGEEDYAPEIAQLPALVALAWTLRRRGLRRQMAVVEEIAEELADEKVECDPEALRLHLGTAVDQEMLTEDRGRFGFTSEWVSEWLCAVHRQKPLPVSRRVDPDLVLNRYRLLEPIGQGGQGVVYRAQDTGQFGKIVVIKVYPTRRVEGVPTSFREAQALSSINHDGVVRCLDYGTDPEKGDVIVLDHVKGDTLQKLLNNPTRMAAELGGPAGKLSVQVKLLEQLVAALQECHSAGVVHKDLKPDNIVVRQSAGIWFPTIIDFGLAARVDGDGQEFKTRGSYTPGYVAPERLRHQPRRASADIYSLGVIAYELLTGAHPFPAEANEAVAAQLAGRFLPAGERRADLPARLSELVGRMLDSEPARRPNAFTLAGELGTALQAMSWREQQAQAQRLVYDEGDIESGLDLLQQAAFSAPANERTTKEYRDVLEALLEAAVDCRKLPAMAPQLVQPFCSAVFDLEPERAAKLQWPGLTKYVRCLVAAQANEPTARQGKRNAMCSVIETFMESGPVPAVAPAVELLLKAMDEPTVWDVREDLFLVSLNYHVTGMLTTERVQSFCIASCRKLRERNDPLANCQIWLRRAERLGSLQSADYRKEWEELDRLFKRTASFQHLPPLPAQQEPADRAVGHDEQGHLDGSRITRWVERLLQLHPYVKTVRRVRKDGGLPPRPSRLLDLANLPKHLAAAKSSQKSGARAVTDNCTIIPALLDDTYCGGTGVPLRINIVLEEGTTAAQRQAAMDLLRRDTTVFPEEC